MSSRHLLASTLLLLWLPFGESQPALAAPRAHVEESAPVSQTAKQETEDLLNMLIPFAKRMLEKSGEFFPFGAAMLSSGKLAAVAVEPTEEHPPSQKVIDDLLKAFRTGAQKGAYRATGLAIDVRTIPPGESEKTDAIEVRLEHVSGYAVHVIFPYRLDHKVVTFGKTFATRGDNDVFNPSAH